MLKTNEYRTQILELYSQGVKPVDIAKKLNFTYWQPVYNLLKKEGILVPLKSGARSKYTLTEDFFRIIDTEEKSWLLGFICADGYVANDRLVISLSIIDLEILEKIKAILNTNVPIVFTKRSNPYLLGKKCCHLAHIQVSSVNFVKPLIELGLSNQKTYTLNSNILKVIPNNLVRHFLRGYFEGDGNVFYGKRYSSGVKYNINICGNEEFLLNTYQKYFPSPNKLYYEKRSRQMFVWKLSSKENVEKFLHYIYDDCSIYLQRKYKVYKNMPI